MVKERRKVCQRQVQSKRKVRTSLGEDFPAILMSREKKKCENSIIINDLRAKVAITIERLRRRGISCPNQPSTNCV